MDSHALSLVQMHIVPPGSTGRRRALLIGINYVGQQGQLSGCHNDVNNIKRYLIREQGFNESEMVCIEKRVCECTG